jgi:hypothetical protein
MLNSQQIIEITPISMICIEELSCSRHPQPRDLTPGKNEERTTGNDEENLSKVAGP